MNFGAAPKKGPLGHFNDATAAMRRVHKASGWMVKAMEAGDSARMESDCQLLGEAVDDFQKAFNEFCRTVEGC
jgi:predicted translin family RNA/ssDNA-binding protein